MIASSPALLAECERSLSVLRYEATRGSSRVEIVAVLSKRFAVYAQPDRSEGEWDAWWADYIEALEDMPPSALEAAMAEYVRQPDSEFFPKPGRVRELARTVPNKIARALRVAEWVVRAAQIKADAEAYAAEARPAPTEAEKQSVRNMLASFQREMAERAPKPVKRDRPPISGPVDEHGITQAMRDRMGNRL